MRTLTSVIILLFLVGCADSYTVRTIRAPSVKLSLEASIYIALPKDGRYGHTVYNGSGLMTQTAFQGEFLAHANKVLIASSIEELDAALASARAEGIDYLCYPVILHWEDRATEWSMIPDKVSVKVTIYDVKNGDEFIATTIDGSSGIATFGGDHPQDLLREPTKSFVGALY